MKSMTGYGWGECASHGFKVTLEVSSVNRKQSEITINLPRELEVLEAQIRDAINRRIARGRLTVRVTVHVAEGKESAMVRLNRPLAHAYAREITRLAQELDMPGPAPLDLILRAPGVLEAYEETADAEEFWPTVEKALKPALDMLIRMREREGTHLQKDLCGRMAAMRKAVSRVKKHAPSVQKRYRQQLLERLRQAGLPHGQLDEERVLKEVVLFADRSDISEELTRLESHFQQFDDCLTSAEPVGRMLDFLAQEMNREINTLGAKANDSLISRNVVVLKAELEKFREQAQNVE